MLNLANFGKRYALPLWPWYLCGVVFLAFTNLITLEIPQLAKQVIDGLGDPQQLSALAQIPLAIVGLGVLQILIRSFSRIFIFWPGRQLEANSKTDLFTKTMSLPQAFFERHGMGDLIARISNDTGQLRVFFSFGALQILNLSFLVIFTITKMSSQHPRLTAICIIPLAMMLVVTRIIMPRMHTYSRASLDAQGRLTSKVTEAFVNMHVIQANAAEATFMASAAKESETVYQTNMRLTAVRTLFFPLLSTITSLAQLIVLFYGGYEVMAGHLTVGDILAFNIYLGYLTFPLSAIGMLLAIYQNSATAIERIAAIDQEESEHAVLTPDRAQGKAPPLLEIRHLNFNFPPRKDEKSRSFALHDINLRLETNEKIGIFGPIGSGKSTLFNLITRIYDPPAGTIFWQGQDVLSLEPRRLRQQVAYALQNAQLFSDSIRHNITFGIEPPPDEAAIQQAAAAAHIAKDVEQLPQKWDTEIGERGIKISGGQKQRLALARLFIRKPQALLLDDVLSAVDHDTEQKLIGSIRRLACPLMIATHRIPVLRDCDRVYVLDNGRLVAQGPFQELIPVIPEFKAYEH